MQGYAYHYGSGTQVEQSSYYASYHQPQPYGSAATSAIMSGYKNQRCEPQALTGFMEFTPSAFPPDTDPKVVQCFNQIDRDGNGYIDDKELQSVLSNYCGYTFSQRTVHLLMHHFTHSNSKMIGPMEFVPLINCLQKWKGIFQRFDRNRNGSIESHELAQALVSLNYKVSPQIIDLLISKFNKSGRGKCSLQYDNFIECCLTVQGLTEEFRKKEDMYGRATFGYEEFLLKVLPFIIA